MIEEKRTFAGADLERILARMSSLAAESAADGLSTMLGQPIRMTTPRLSLVPLHEVADRLGGPEEEAAGIYLLVTGDLPGHVMLMLRLADSLRLVDMLMEMPEGTTEALEDMERSALCEVGNVATCLFVNAIAEAAGLDIRPSPPALVVDMVGAILDVILVSAGAISDDILLLDAQFHGPDSSVGLYFWLVPDPGVAARC